MIVSRTPVNRTIDPRQLILALLLALLLFGSVSAAHAQNPGALRSQMAQGAGPGQSRDSERGERLPPNVAPGEAARRASREYGGRVLNVVLEDGPGGPYYRVKLLDGGRVRIVHVEARH
ncbi:hypothetical protein [Salinisphaera sp. T31B1]|uniref:PepSY domain-containing protein n=1 Tax=Salinisphaera sp. T31B1 TaxID=727963 RepID=UPI0033409E68